MIESEMQKKRQEGDDRLGENKKVKELEISTGLKKWYNGCNRVVRARRIRERLWSRIEYYSLRFQRKYISRDNICCFPTDLRLENGICITHTKKVISRYSKITLNKLKKSFQITYTNATTKSTDFHVRTDLDLSSSMATQ